MVIASVKASDSHGNGAANTMDRNLNTCLSAFGKGQWIQYDLGATKRWAGSASPPFLDPEALSLEGAHETLRVGIALRVIVAGKGLLDLQGSAGCQKSHRGGVAAVIIHQRQALIMRTAQKLPIYGHVQGLQPLLRRPPKTRLVADDLPGMPVEHNHDVDPAKAAHQHLGHVNALPSFDLMGLGLRAVGVRWAFSRRWGRTRSWCSRIRCNTRFLLTGHCSMKRRDAQMRR
jgi:hypothetical protein